MKKIRKTTFFHKKMNNIGGSPIDRKPKNISSITINKPPIKFILQPFEFLSVIIRT